MNEPANPKTPLAKGNAPSPNAASWGAGRPTEPLVGFALVQWVEALLFLGIEPLQLARLREAFPWLSASALVTSLRVIEHRYRMQKRPYGIIRSTAGYHLALLPRYRELFQERNRASRGVVLSKIVKEVLALVAYKQPVTRAEIERLRGVDVAGPLRQLVRRDLIEIQTLTSGDEVATPRYITTARFLEIFGLTHITELPHLEDLENI